MVFQTLTALVDFTTFHGVMTGCLRCQGAHITARERETKRGSNKCDRETEVDGGEEPTGRNSPSLTTTSSSNNLHLERKIPKEKLRYNL